jgi:diguanylate cyclase (GGDEF)-like protein
LKGVSAEIASHIRITDCLARYGGEEFCCLLPETELTNAITLAERFRILVESLNLTYQNTNQVNVTISLGVSELADNDSPESLLKKADEALYEAKRTGRNRVVVES